MRNRWTLCASGCDTMRRSKKVEYAVYHLRMYSLIIMGIIIMFWGEGYILQNISVLKDKERLWKCPRDYILFLIHNLCHFRAQISFHCWCYRHTYWVWATYSYIWHLFHKYLYTFHLCYLALSIRARTVLRNILSPLKMISLGAPKWGA